MPGWRSVIPALVGQLISNLEYDRAHEGHCGITEYYPPKNDELGISQVLYGVLLCILRTIVVYQMLRRGDFGTALSLVVSCVSLLV